MSVLGILVGPGVVRANCVAGLAAFARRAGCGVVNTWGAKGVFRWDDPLHFGTAGLQAWDFDLAGLGEVDVLVTSGLDPEEVTSQPWEGRAEVVDVAPEALGTFRGTLPAGCHRGSVVPQTAEEPGRSTSHRMPSGCPSGWTAKMGIRFCSSRSAILSRFRADG